MKTLTYSITINKPKAEVYEALLDKTLFPKWAAAWGEGMTSEGKWEKGEHVSFFNTEQGGTKVVIEDIQPGEHIRARHIAMVGPDNVEVAELADETMKKWIGSIEEYHFTAVDENTTTLEVRMEIDPMFEEMSANWPKALELFKQACEER